MSSPMPSPAASAREAMLQRLQREVGQSVADGILLQQAIADRVGLGLADLKCLTILGYEGSATAGTIAAHTGLTTGAVTRMIDRLEAAGWVTRERDPHDRRKVIVRPVEARAVEIVPLIGGMEKAWAAAMADYPDEQVALLLDLFERMRSIAREQAARIRALSD